MTTADKSTMAGPVTLGQLSAQVRRDLSAAYGESEGQAMTRIVMEESLRMAPVDVVMRRDEELLPESVTRVERVVERLLAGEPIQYVYGHTQWYGSTLAVSPDVLIPRPETEQLVDMIVDDWGKSGRRDLRVLDIGTGSGAIAVTLARVLPFADVEAIDISEGALTVARDNARRQRVRVNFRREDALSMKARGERYDIIVSNPPYIPLSDGNAMERTVLDHEPHMALFVPDDDPMKFYRPITEFAAEALTPGGKLYFELDPAGAPEVARLMRDARLVDVETLRDFAGRVRFAVGRKS